MIHQLKRTQQLNCDTASAWSFFSSPHNLSKITPKDMGFVVLSDVPDEDIYVGMIIDYSVSPLLGIPLIWQTKIIQVDHEKSFTDFQKKGPYTLWSHHHEFFPNQDGLLMTDTVNYELPFGIIGTLVHHLFIKKKLDDIFNYRYQVLEQLFNKQKN